MAPPRPEVLAPAGTPDKLRTALHFGADAVYLGLKQFSLRTFAGNFDYDELEWALGYAHERGARVYVAVNVQPFDEDLAPIGDALKRLGQLRPDAVILADPGLLPLARRHCGAVDLHLSTQASVTNAAAARFWLDQGFSRIIAARELSLQQLGRLVRDCGGEVEAFVHGAVCIAYSGRCLLSLYWADRDPRRGACAQGCRWPYHMLVDRRRPDEPNPVSEDERGTYFFDAKDLCGLEVLEPLVATGLRSLKIEGRTRSAHYVAATVDVYRRGVELLAQGDAAELERQRPALMAELSRACHRGFSTHFLTGEEPGTEAYNPEGSYAHGRSGYVGLVVARTDEHVVVALRNPVAAGAPLEIRDRDLRCEPAVAEPLLSHDGEPLEQARSGDRIRLLGRFQATPGALVRNPPPAPADP